jgi:hypothetical protein
VDTGDPQPRSVAWNARFRSPHGRVTITSMANDDVAALYRQPIEGFIAARDALVAQLRERGHAEDAASVKALRKPTVPAWAIDQLAHLDPAGIAQLLDAGAEVRAAQQATLSSARSAERLRHATAERRTVIARLVSSAEDALRRSGREPASHTEAIASTLEAASVDPELGDRVRAGTLDRQASATSGFGDVFGLHVATGGEPDAGAPRVPAKAEAKAPSQAELGKLRRDRDAAAREAVRTQEAADTLAERVAAAEARLRELEARHGEARARAAQAETAAARARAAFDRAAKREDTRGR